MEINKKKKWRHHHRPSYVLLLIHPPFGHKIDSLEDNNPRVKHFHFGMNWEGEKHSKTKMLEMENVRGAGCGGCGLFPLVGDTQLLPGSTTSTHPFHLQYPPKIIVWFNCKMGQTSVGRQHGGAWVGIETEETLAKSASRYDTKETYSPFVDISIFCFVNLSLKYS